MSCFAIIVIKGEFVMVAGFRRGVVIFRTDERQIGTVTVKCSFHR